MEGKTATDHIPAEPAVKRYKFLWRVFLMFNFALGAYMFAQAGKKERVKEKVEAPSEVAPVPSADTAPSQEEPVVSTPITTPIIPRPPVPEEQQRELFKWMLEEKRKAKPRGREEKKRIDEEKAILKQFIRAKSIPSI